MIRGSIQATGGAFLGFLAEVGALWGLASASLDRIFLGPFRGDRMRWRMAIQECVRSGYDSLPLVALISGLVGMILALQSTYQLERLGATSLVSNLVAVTVVRELAPLLTAILIAGRYGSAITAELGTMRVSQEIDALTVMGIDPVSLLVVPRLLGLLIALPCLTIFADAIGILGGLVVAVLALGLGGAGYLIDSIDALQMRDVLIGLTKAAVFGAIIGLVGCQRGISTAGGAEGVGRATTSSVVRAIVLIIGADLFVTALFYIGG